MTPNKQPRNVPRLDVLERFSLSPSGLHKQLKLGNFPRPFYIGGKPLWREADLAAVEAGTWKPEPRPAPEPEPEPLDLDEPARPKPLATAPARPRGRPPKVREASTSRPAPLPGLPGSREVVPVNLGAYR